MKAVLFSDTPETYAGTRSRVLKFASLLVEDGHRCIVCLPFDGKTRARLWEDRPPLSKVRYLVLLFLLRCWQLRHVIGADAVFVHRRIFPYGPPLFERLAWLFNRRLIVDLDDAVWYPAGYVSSPFMRLVDHGWARKVCGFAAHVIAGNRYIEEYTRQFCAHVTIIPTCVDMSTHTEKDYTPKSRDEPVILGWTGLWTNLGYMEVIEDVLRRLAARHSIVLSIASSRDYRLDGVPVVNHRWVLSHEIDYLKEPDIGLMPLTNTERAQGKCAYKALEYMAVGTPCVISPVGMNREIIEDGVNGFLADTPQEWEEKLERLILDAVLRQRLGRAARETVAAHYAHDVHFQGWKHVFEQVAGLGSRARHAHE
ncbi:MAG: glycosyltransferase family 4 protein [Candidatus Hydrogenedentes bacterium]|nr:glycosyltransferase family 4 protein [Candidatus Hydrogenedentota bacterium]